MIFSAILDDPESQKEVKPKTPVDHNKLKTLTEETINENSLKRSGSFVFDQPMVDASPRIKTSKNLASQSSRAKSKLPSRPSSSQKMSTSSLAPPKSAEMNLPHKLGATPKYLENFKAKKQQQLDDDVVTKMEPKSTFTRAGSFVVETKTSKLRQGDSKSNFSGSSSPISTPNPQNPQSLPDSRKFTAKNLPAMYKNVKKEKSCDSKEFLSRSVSSAPPGEGESLFQSTENLELLKSDVKLLSEKALQEKKRSVELTKTIDSLRKNVSELEKQLQEKNAELNVKDEKIKLLGVAKKTQRDKSDKIATTENQLAESKKIIIELEKQMEKKDENVQKLKAEIQRIKRDLDGKIKQCESLQLEKKNLEQLMDTFKKNQGMAVNKRQVELEHMVQDLEIQLETRNDDVSRLKEKAESLAGENVSLRTNILK